MIREITRPQQPVVPLPMYIGFLLGEPKHGSCCRLAEVMDISHPTFRTPPKEKNTLKLSATN